MTAIGSNITAATKFDYLLNCGFENLKVCHHPSIVVRQAWTFTSLKYTKDWNKITGMTPEQQLRHRWNLVRIMLVNEGMTPFVREWYSLLPTDIQELPLTTHAYHFGETLMTHFNASFEFPSLQDHYRTVLEAMSKETLKLPMDGAQELKELLSRAFRVHSIFGAVGTLQFMLYVSAVIDPFPKGHSLVNSLVDSSATPASRNWPTFFNNLRRIVTNRGLFVKNIYGEADKPKPAEDLSRSDSAPKKVTWKSLRESEQPRSPGFSPRGSSSRGYSRMNTVNSRRQDNPDEDYDEGSEEQLNRSLAHSRANALTQEVQTTLRNQAAAQQSLQDQVSTMMTAMNALLQKQVNAPDLPPSYQLPVNAMQNPGGGSSQGNKQASRNKRSWANSNKPWQQQANPMDKYGPGGGQPKADIHDGGNKRPRYSDTHVDRYLHNPAGPENWKRWFRVCNGCGRYVAHFQKMCRAPRRHNYKPNEDPRVTQPIESYPANYPAALERAQQEFKEYGSQVRWNCPEQYAPTPDQLA
jgi:hypothetical protein